MRTLSILKTVSVVAAVSAVAITATTGKASAIVFNLGGNTLLNPGTITDIPSGIQLTSTASAVARPGNTLTGTTDVLRTINGLGVLTSTVPVLNDNNQVDGLRAIETLTLAFNQAVNLTSVTFTSVGLTDSFVFIINNLNNPQIVLPSQPIPGGALLDTGSGDFTPSSAIGTSFGFRASQIDDDFFVSSVNVTAVPEPITIAGMALGSGFGVLLRRKYKKAAKFSNKLNT